LTTRGLDGCRRELTVCQSASCYGLGHVTTSFWAIFTSQLWVLSLK